MDTPRGSVPVSGRSGITVTLAAAATSRAAEMSNAVTKLVWDATTPHTNDPSACDPMNTSR